jgi:hypothetical protein
MRETIVTKAFFSAIVILFLPLWLVFGNPTELSIRLIGLSAQILGIIVAFWGLISLTWINAALGLPRHFKIEGETGAYTLKGSDAILSYRPGAAGPIETRLNALETNMIAMEEHLTNLIKENFQNIADQLNREKQSRRDDGAALRKNFEATRKRDLRYSLMGAGWIFVGTILSTVSQEFHAWISGFPYFGFG